jgi:hypothetical protein
MNQRTNVGGSGTGPALLCPNTGCCCPFCGRGGGEGTHKSGLNSAVGGHQGEPPKELKISPIAAIPHKSKAHQSILDLSFRLRLKSDGVLSAVNDTMEKSATKGAIDQIGESLSRIIYAFSKANKDAKTFMAKWDIKDGFWRMDCENREEWNLVYVLPQEQGKLVQIVVPTFLQMGWVESPPYFCAAIEMTRDVATDYIETPVNLL